MHLVNIENLSKHSLSLLLKAKRFGEKFLKTKLDQKKQKI